jgi:hypothetical protein
VLDDEVPVTVGQELVAATGCGVAGGASLSGLVRSREW